ncbi:hypothetical protein TNCV_3810151 [Trichonephila clavipes]|nr:hypothetical protein TNCV_3810151 [Trichonephila clavipes]
MGILSKPMISVHRTIHGVADPFRRVIANSMGMTNHHIKWGRIPRSVGENRNNCWEDDELERRVAGASW